MHRVYTGIGDQDIDNFAAEILQQREAGGLLVKEPTQKGR